METTAQFWNKIASRYAARAISDTATYEKKLALTRQYFTPESEVLEFGCGTGSTALLHAPYVKQMTAIDFAPAMIDIAEQNRQEAVNQNLAVDNVAFRCATLDDPELANRQFDAVLGLNVLHLIEDYPAAIRQVVERLKPGGVFVSSSACLANNWSMRLLVPLMQWLGKAPKLVYFSPQQLKAAMSEAGLEIVEQLEKGDMLFLIARKPSLTDKP